MSMTSLAPEILSHIFQLAVPSPSFKNSRERLSNLGAFCLVCTTWKEEAQRLLLQDPVIVIRDVEDRSFRWRIGRLISGANLRVDQHIRVKLREVNKCCRSRQPPHYSSTDQTNQRISLRMASRSDRNFEGDFTRQRRGLLGEQRKARVDWMTGFTTVTTLTLWGVTLDPNILGWIPTLRKLSLSDVMYTIGCCGSVHDAHLDRYVFSLPLTDLSVTTSTKGSEPSLPHCLLPPQLPNLQRLAYPLMARHTVSTFKYSIDQISQILPQLDFYSVNIDKLSSSKDDIALIADKTLFDFPSSVSHSIRAGRFGNREGFCLIKQIRILGGDLAEEGGVDNNWSVKALDPFFATTLPGLKTLVVPAKWSASTLYGELVDMAERKGMKLLQEELDYDDEGRFESLISPAFTEHRRREREEAF